MQRLANQAEREARDSAKQALEEAERAAREQGAKSLADALKQQAEAFDKRRAEAQALRELGRALEGQLDPEALEDLKEFGSTGDPEAGRRLAEAMGKALSKLSEEERKRLAEQLKKQIAQSPQGALDWSGLMAGTLVAALPIFILFIAFGKKVVNSIGFSGIK